MPAAAVAVSVSVSVTAELVGSREEGVEWGAGAVYGGLAHGTKAARLEGRPAVASEETPAHVCGIVMSSGEA
jgi:hypothetical protein